MNKSFVFLFGALLCVVYASVIGAPKTLSELEREAQALSLSGVPTPSELAKLHQKLAALQAALIVFERENKVRGDHPEIDPELVFLQSQTTERLFSQTEEFLRKLSDASKKQREQFSTYLNEKVFDQKYLTSYAQSILETDPQTLIKDPAQLQHIVYLLTNLVAYTDDKLKKKLEPLLLQATKAFEEYSSKREQYILERVDAVAQKAQLLPEDFKIRTGSDAKEAIDKTIRPLAELYTLQDYNLSLFYTKLATQAIEKLTRIQKNNAAGLRYIKSDLFPEEHSMKSFMKETAQQLKDDIRKIDQSETEGGVEPVLGIIAKKSRSLESILKADIWIRGSGMTLDTEEEQLYQEIKKIYPEALVESEQKEPKSDTPKTPPGTFNITSKPDQNGKEPPEEPVVGSNKNFYLVAAAAFVAGLGYIAYKRGWFIKIKEYFMAQRKPKPDNEKTQSPTSSTHHERNQAHL